MNYDLFISYSGKDRTYVEELAHRLKNEAGLDAWWFQGKQRPGKRYTKEIINHIANSSAMLLIFSSYSADAPLVMEEFVLADRLDKLIIPIAIGEETGRSFTEPVRLAELTQPIRLKHTIDARGGRDPLPELLAELANRSASPIHGVSQNNVAHTLSNEILTDLTDQTIKGYTFQECIDQTQLSVIYRAREVAIARDVIIKVITPQYTNQSTYIRLFEEEARRVAHLEHPHIVPLYNYWRDASGAYLVMRQMPGGSLEQALASGPLTLTTFARHFAQLANALIYAHHQGVIHRDIKPANILLDRGGNAYLSDFGIAQDPAAPAAVGYSPGYAPLEQHGGIAATPQTDVYSLGAVVFEMLIGKPAFAGTPSDIFQSQRLGIVPSLRKERPELSETFDTILQHALDPDPTARYTNVASFALAISSALSEQLLATGISQRETDEIILPPDLPAAANPYKGLQAFMETDVADFFGREVLTRHLIERLNETGTDVHFLAVVGPSGGGKSSVVRAGLLPALRRGELPNAQHWYIAVVTPGAEPIDNLAATLTGLTAQPLTNIHQQLYADDHALVHIVNQILPSDPAVELLLVIDQFEELYTLANNDALRQCMLALLVAAVRDPHSRIRVVITLRADFYDRPLSDPVFGPLVQARSEAILPLKKEEFADAIIKPAQGAGVQIERALVREMLADVEDQAGALPLLQYALHDLFEQRNGTMLTFDQYDARGGIQGALDRRADDVYAELTPAHQALARQIFLRLVTPGDRSVTSSEDAGDTRRRVRQSELALLFTPSPPPLAATHTTVPGELASSNESTLDDAALLSSESVGAFEPAWMSIVQTFGRARLLTLDVEPNTHEPTVEVAHEALIHAWKRLHNWLNEARDDLRTHRRINEAATEWMRLERDPEYLSSGGPLAQFEELMRKGSVALNRNEHAFLTASIAVRKQEEAAERERQARDLEQVQALAREQMKRIEDQTMATLKLRRRAIFLGVALLLALVTTVIALFSGIQVRHQSDLAQARLLVEKGSSLAKTRPLVGLYQALEGLYATPSNELEVRTELITTTTEIAQQGRVHLLVQDGLNVDGDGTANLTASSDNSIFFVARDGKAGELLDTKNGAVTTLTEPTDKAYFSPYSPWVVFRYHLAPGELRNLRNGDVTHLPDIVVGGTSFSSNGEWVLIQYLADFSELRNLQTGTSIRLPGQPFPNFSPDGTWAFFEYVDGPDELRNLKDGKVIQLAGNAYEAVFYGDNTHAIVSFRDRRGEIWDLQTGKYLRLTGIIEQAKLSPDGNRVILIYKNAQSELRDLKTDNILVLNTTTNDTFGTVISPDNSWVVPRGNKVPQIHNVANNIITQLSDPVQDAFFNSDTSWLALNYQGKPGELRSLQSNNISRLDDVLISAKFSPDNKWVMIVYDKHVGEIHNLLNGKILQLSRDVDEGYRGVIFSLSSKLVLLRYLDNTSEIWELGDKPVLLTRLKTGVTDFLFYPDDQHAAVAYNTGEIYLLDLAFLRAIGGADGTPSEETLFQAACAGPLASDLWTPEDQKALEQALAGRTPQACPPKK